MINWNDPDYVSAGMQSPLLCIMTVPNRSNIGHFYALVSSVSIKCADPQAPGPNITSYVYGQNASTDTPGVDFSNQSTIDAAYTIGINSKVHVAVAIIIGLVAVLQVI
jgi:hypothetical protein